MKAIGVAVSAAGIAAMVAVVASGQVVLVAAKRQAIWLHPPGRTGEVQDVGENFENDHHRH
jgi:hypothetical protein